MSVEVKELLEAGIHFGHQSRRWNPKMAKYIFGKQNNIYVIDLKTTVKKLPIACHFVQEIAARGESILFVGTKRQAQAIVEEEARRCSMFYVNHRWLGGMLTNFTTIRKSIEKLAKLEADQQSGSFALRPKKEVVKLEKAMGQLRWTLEGIKSMGSLPAALFIIDTVKEQTAVMEANRLGIPVIAIVDTDCNPDEVDYVIPGNDDSIRAIALITRKISDAILEGRLGAEKESVPPASVGSSISGYSFATTAP